ncbi:hypothetical protein GWK47_010388 [Chionoecetes opilio]|uniref:Uncharacterized protein n=1 Tax=Chionoecetes opilio TaxID=41210 RepID=A0A8J4XY83_CHIOP|nr:hypothetical protein GWK47_010388 [Chionoecetes opilio]
MGTNTKLVAISHSASSSIVVAQDNECLEGIFPFSGRVSPPLLVSPLPGLFVSESPTISTLSLLSSPDRRGSRRSPSPTNLCQELALLLTVARDAEPPMIYLYTYREQLEVHYSIPVLLPSLFSRTYTSPFSIEVTGYSDEACSVPNSKCRTDIRRRPTLPFDSVVAAKLFLKAASAAASLVPVEVGGLNVAVTVGLEALPPVQATHVVQRHHVSCGSNKRQST